MTSLQDIQALNASSQPIRTDRLFTMLKQCGFETKTSNGGSSHVTVYHPQRDDIDPFTLVVNSKDIRYKKLTLQACANALSEPLEDNHLEPATDIAFNSKATDHYELPESFEIVRGRNNPGLFLRHKTYPQIATRLQLYQAGDDISEYCKYLEGRAEKLDAVINLAITEHGFEKTEHPNGMVLLSHPMSPVNRALYPFTPRLRNYSSISVVEELIDELEKEQIELGKLVDAVLQAQGLVETTRKDDNARTFRFTNPLNANDTIELSLSRTRHGHISLSSIITISNTVNERFWKSFAKNMKASHGFNVERNTNGYFVGKHPFSGVRFEIYDHTGKSGLLETLKNYNEQELGDPDSSEDKIKAYFESMALAGTKLQQAISDSNEILIQARARYFAFLKSNNCQPVALNKKQLTEGRALDAEIIDFTGQKIGYVRLMPVRTKHPSTKQSIQVVIDPNSVDKLEEAAKHNAQKSDIPFAVHADPNKHLQKPKSANFIKDALSGLTLYPDTG